jgi:hypothetical protein
LAFGNAVHASVCGLYANPLLVIVVLAAVTPPETSSRPLAAVYAEPQRSAGRSAIGDQLLPAGSYT